MATPPQLSIEENIRKQLKADVQANQAAAAASEAERDALAASTAALEQQLAAREAAAAEMEDVVGKLREDIARLDALNAELKAASAAKVWEAGMGAAWHPAGTFSLPWPPASPLPVPPPCPHRRCHS